MKIQSLSICTPYSTCKLDCPFCISRMYPSHDLYPYCNIDDEYNKKQFLDRMQYVKDCGCNDMIITGTGEPTEPNNMKFVRFVLEQNLFKKVDIQTNGTNINEVLLSDLAWWGVKTISLSLRSLKEYQICEKQELDVKKICQEIVETGFNLRLSLNISDLMFEKEKQLSLNHIIECAQKYGASEVTLRKLYYDTLSARAIHNKQEQWVIKHALPHDWFIAIMDKIKMYGTKIQILPFGSAIYNVEGINFVIDEDCMAQQAKDKIKYAILRPNAKLYARWDIPALIF